MKLTLASQSAWRKELFSWFELPFTVRPADIDEELYETDDPEETVGALAAAKAEKIVKTLAEQRVFGADDEIGIVVAADTIVWLDEQIIGKPKNLEDARRIITLLAGKTHEVWTGVCVMQGDSGEQRVETERTEVTFAPMTEREIEDYLATKEWEGKAGGYQVQMSIAKYVTSINGSFTNIIGMPMKVTSQLLEEFTVPYEVDVRQTVEAKLGYPD